MTAGDALPISLTTIPSGVVTGAIVCPDTLVSITCIAYNVRALQWLRNDSEIESFTSLDMPSSVPRQSGPFSVYLNSSVNDGQNNLNVTSTLLGLASDFQRGDNVSCVDATGDSVVLNFTSEL